LGARHKLNAAYQNGSLFLAVMAGVFTQSIFVFVLVYGLSHYWNVRAGFVRHHPQQEPPRPFHQKRR
jgi:hypothetical protein